MDFFSQTEHSDITMTIGRNPSNIGVGRGRGMWFSEATIWYLFDKTNHIYSAHPKQHNDDSWSSSLYSIMGGFFTHKWQKNVDEYSFQIPVDLVPLTFWVTSEILECCCKQNYKNNIPHLYTDLAWSMKHPNKVLVTPHVWAYSYVGRVRA